MASRWLRVTPTRSCGFLVASTWCFTAITIRSYSLSMLLGLSRMMEALASLSNMARRTPRLCSAWWRRKISSRNLRLNMVAAMSSSTANKAIKCKSFQETRGENECCPSPLAPFAGCTCCATSLWSSTYIISPPRLRYSSGSVLRDILLRWNHGDQKKKKSHLGNQ